MNTDTTMNINIEELTQKEDLSEARALLEKYELPADNMDKDSVVLYGIREEGELIAIGGYEQYDENAFIRSVAVYENVQKRGIGKQIVEHLEQQASEKGVKNLYLLTTDAKEFFLHRGYKVIDRDKVPDSIKGTSEFAKFSAVCAFCMVHSLEKNEG